MYTSCAENMCANDYIGGECVCCTCYMVFDDKNKRRATAWHRTPGHRRGAAPPLLVVVQHNDNLRLVALTDLNYNRGTVIKNGCYLCSFLLIVRAFYFVSWTTFQSRLGKMGIVFTLLLCKSPFRFSWLVGITSNIWPRLYEFSTAESRRKVDIFMW